MAAGIAHEIRNPMTAVRGYLQWFNQEDAFVEHRESIVIMIEELDVQILSSPSFCHWLRIRGLIWY